MKMFQLKFPKKLLCFELKIGAIITGWFHLILSILGIILTLVIHFNHEVYVRALEYMSGAYNETNFYVFEDVNEEKYLQLQFKLAGGFYLFLCIVNLVAASFLIYGSIKENHLHLVPWLASEVLGMFLMLSTIFVKCPYLVIVLFPRLYIWYCIWAFYRDIKRIKQISGYPIGPPVAAFGNETAPTKPPSYGDVVAFK